MVKTWGFRDGEEVGESEANWFGWVEDGRRAEGNVVFGNWFGEY
jgi:hypothetical protein